MEKSDVTMLYLVRHGETDWSRDGNRYCGRTNVSLNATGLEQARQVGDALHDRPIATIYASPLDRAMATAQVIAMPHNLSVDPVTDLVEIDFGRWDGLQRSDIERNDFDQWSRWLNNPATTVAGHTGETANDVLNRTKPFFESLVRSHGGESIVIVAHNTLNRLVIAESLEMPLFKYRSLSQNCGAVTIAELTMHETRWISINQTRPDLV